MTGSSEELRIENSKTPEAVAEKQEIKDECISIKVNIITSSGMELSRDGLDYRSLRTFIERLEGLIC